MSLNAFVYIATSLGEGEIHNSGELVLLRTHKNKVSHQGDRTVFKAYSLFCFFVFFSEKVNQKATRRTKQKQQKQEKCSHGHFKSQSSLTQSLNR